MISSYKNSSLYQNDLDSLEEGRWLTGEAINLGFILLEEEFDTKSVKLVDPSVVSFLLFQSDQQELRTLEKLDLFECRYLYIPVNTNQQKHSAGDHWTLCIYDILKSSFYMMNSMEGMSSNVQKIKSKMEQLRHLFKSEETSIKIQAISNLPKQQNSYDCGVFVLFYAYSTLVYLRSSPTHSLKFHDVIYDQEYFQGIRETLRNKIAQNKK